VSREIDRKIATELLGFEVQESPRGVLYIHHETDTWPLPDYSSDLVAIESACDAWCMQDDSRSFGVARIGRNDYYASLSGLWLYFYANGPTMAAALYNALVKAMGAAETTPT
jgi:hypothetical protein